MAALSKILGVLSFLFAGLIMLNVLVSFATADWSDAGEESLSGVASTITLAVLFAQAGFALLLSTVGAAAWCVGSMADESAAAALERRSGWDAQPQFDASIRR